MPARAAAAHDCTAVFCFILCCYVRRHYTNIIYTQVAGLAELQSQKTASLGSSWVISTWPPTQQTISRWHTDPLLQNWTEQAAPPCKPKDQCLSRGGGSPPLPMATDNSKIFRLGDPARPFQYNGSWYLVVVGAGRNVTDRGEPQLLGEARLFRALDPKLLSWEFVSVVFATNRTLGRWESQPTNMLECPDMFQLGSSWVMLFNQICQTVGSREGLLLTRAAISPARSTNMTSGTTEILTARHSHRPRVVHSTMASSLRQSRWQT